jgi:hypothetical protein
MPEYDLPCKYACPYVDVGDPHPCGTQIGQGNEVCANRLHRTFPSSSLRGNLQTGEVDVYDDDNRPIAEVENGTVFEI